MSERRPAPGRPEKGFIPVTTPSDQWRARIVLRTRSDRPIKDRFFDVKGEIPDNKVVRLIDKQSEVRSSDTFRLQLAIDREPGNLDFLTQPAALHAGLVVVHRALHITGNGGMTIASADMQRASVMESVADLDPLRQERYWWNFTGEAIKEFVRLDVTETPLYQLERSLGK